MQIYLIETSAPEVVWTVKRTVPQTWIPETTLKAQHNSIIRLIISCEVDRLIRVFKDLYIMQLVKCIRDNIS